MIRLIASDLDGTLLQNGATRVAPSVFSMIKKLKEKGILFVVSSGRQYHNLRVLFEPVKDDIGYVCENGAVVAYKDKILDYRVFPKELGRSLTLELKKQEDLEVLLSGVDCSYIESKEKEYIALLDEMKNRYKIVEDIAKMEEDFVKIAIYNKDGVNRKMEECFAEKFSPEVNVVTSGTQWIDFLIPGVDKRYGLSIFEEKMGITPDEMMAFGDNYNDIEMLEYVKYSVAVTNARTKIKEISSYGTDTVENMVKRVLDGSFDE